MERIPVAGAASHLEGEVSQESQETLSKLREYVRQGYLLHGSKYKGEMLEPRQASDTDKDRITGKQHAVYATGIVEIPVFMALRDRKDTTNPSMHSAYSGDGKTFHMSGTNLGFTPGYVYVLPRESFELETDGNGDEEFISRKPVKPIDVVQVKPDIMGLFDTVTLDLK